MSALSCTSFKSEQIMAAMRRINALEAAVTSANAISFTAKYGIGPSGEEANYWVSRNQNALAYNGDTGKKHAYVQRTDYDPVDGYDVGIWKYNDVPDDFDPSSKIPPPVGGNDAPYGLEHYDDCFWMIELHFTLSVPWGEEYRVWKYDITAGTWSVCGDGTWRTGNGSGTFIQEIAELDGTMWSLIRSRSSPYWWKLATLQSCANSCDLDTVYDPFVDDTLSGYHLRSDGTDLWLLERFYKGETGEYGVKMHKIESSDPSTIVWGTTTFDWSLATHGFLTYLIWDGANWWSGGGGQTLYPQHTLSKFTTVSGQPGAETTWFRYPTTDSKASLGTPDGGVSVPDLGGIGGDDSIFTNQNILDMRGAIKSLAQYYKNATTGNAFNWNDSDADNLYFVALGDRTQWGATGGAKYDWTRDSAGMDADPKPYDIDFGEVLDILDKLEASALV